MAAIPDGQSLSRLTPAATKTGRWFAGSWQTATMSPRRGFDVFVRVFYNDASPTGLKPAAQLVATDNTPATAAFRRERGVL